MNVRTGRPRTIKGGKVVRPGRSEVPCKGSEAGEDNENKHHELEEAQCVAQVDAKLGGKGMDKTDN